jgi:signal transduction histidine kinase
MQIQLSASASESLTTASLLRETAASPVIAVDATRTILAADLGALQLLGPGAGLLHKPVGILPPPLRDVIEEVFSKGRPIDYRALRWSAAGGELEIAVRAIPGCDRSGVVQFVVLSLADISAAQRLGARMQQLERLANVGSFSANTSHEIRNALVAIKTFLDLLVGRNQDVELAGLAAREVRRIDAIAGQILTFSGPPKPSLALLRLHEVLDESLQLLEYQTEKKQVRLYRSFAASADWIKGDKSQLEQAFINLHFNALEAMDEGGELRVATRNEGGKIVVSIQDTGSGIAPGHMKQLFQPFFTTKPGGTGLGLPITWRVVQEHGGEMSVESEPGKGTTFALSFPRSDNKPPGKK